MKGDIHIHSKYSYDSLMEPRNILKLCKKFEYDVISITDHDSIKGSIEAKKYEKEFGIQVLMGEEVKTDSGDLIGLNLNDEIKSKNWIEVLEEIKDQGAISVFPHPYRGHRNIEEIARRVDLIETFNSRSNRTANEKAAELAFRFGKSPVSGSDAHIYREIGNATMIFDDLFKKKKKFENKYTKRYCKVSSYLIKDIKLRRYYRIPLDLARLVI